MRKNYLFKGQKSVCVNGTAEHIEISIDMFKEAISVFDDKIRKISEVEEGIFAILGMRNLSAFIGEVFVGSLAKVSGETLIKNPHQDGYPDLLIMTEEGKTLLKTLCNNMRDKKPFSRFATGGIEIKATCGSVPTPAILSKKGLHKPDIGDQRITLLMGYDWKAHHRETNNLIGLVWDFIDKLPTITGIFFGAQLLESDWGKIIHPKEGGGRTTSVSIMTRGGVYKMYADWVAVIDDKAYIDFFNRYNKANLIVPNSGA